MVISNNPFRQFVIKTTPNQNAKVFFNLVKTRRRHWQALISLALSLLFLLLPTHFSKALASDGNLRVDIGTDGYFEVPDLLEASTKIYKLNDGQSFLSYGSRTNNPDSKVCTDYASFPVLKNLYYDGSPSNAAFGNVILSKFSGLPNVRFSDIAQDSSNFIYLAGYQSEVNQSGSESNINCSYPNGKNFLIKLSTDGSILNLGENEITYFNQGYLSSVNIFSEGVLALTFTGNGDADIIFINSSDGSIVNNLGNNGIVKLKNDSIDVFSAVKTSNGLVVFGHVHNESNDWILRWAISEIDLNGIETDRFKGFNNYQYSSGIKEGIYTKPILRGNYIYIINGVLNDSTYDIKTMRIGTDGTIDKTYGGYLRSQLLAKGIEPCSYCSGEFAVDNYGRVVISIGTNQSFDNGARKSVVVRLNQHGNIDTTFGNDGILWLNMEYQAGIYSINVNQYFAYGVQYSNTYCSGNTCGLYKTFLSRLDQNPPTPIINSIYPDNGFINVRIQLDQVLEPIGNWFYQVETSGDGCVNPYGNDSTWNTDSLVDSFQIGNVQDDNSDGFDLSQPLTNGCTYTIRVAHWNSQTSNYTSTTVVPGSPSAKTLPASSISGLSATLNGEINAKSLPTSASFCLSTNSNLADCTIYNIEGNPVDSTSSNKNVFQRVENLIRGTTYYYRLISSNTANTTLGETLSFRTLSLPTNSTSTATNIQGTSAVLRGSVNAQGSQTKPSFCYGTAPDLSGCKEAELNDNLVSGTSDTEVSIEIKNLSFDTTYYFRLSSTNAAGNSIGSIVSFKTIDEVTQLKNIEQAKQDEEKRKAEELALQAKAIRDAAREKFKNLQNEASIEINTFKEAGISSVIPETLNALSSFLATLDSEKRNDFTIIESKAKELKQNFYLSEINKEVTLKNLDELGISNVSEKIISELKPFIEKLGIINSENLSLIQKEVTKVNTLFSGRETGTLNAAQLNTLGIKTQLPNKLGQVLLKFQGQPKEIFASVESITAKLAEIEKVIIARLEKTSAGKAKTEEIRRKLLSRNPSK